MQWGVQGSLVPHGLWFAVATEAIVAITLQQPLSSPALPRRKQELVPLLLALVPRWQSELPLCVWASGVSLEGCRCVPTL